MEPLDLDPDSDEATFVEQRLTGRDLLGVAHWMTAFGMPSQLFIAQKTLNKLEMLAAAGVKFEFQIAHVGDQVPRDLVRARGLVLSSAQKHHPHIQVWLNGSGVSGKVGTSIATVLNVIVRAAVVGSLRLRELSAAQAMQSCDELRVFYELAAAVTEHFGQWRLAYEDGRLELSESEKKLLFDAKDSIKSTDATLAWILSSVDAYGYLQSIPYQGKPLWTRYVDAIRTILDLPLDTHAALSQALRVIEAAVEDASDAAPAARDTSANPMATQTGLHLPRTGQ